MQCLGKTEWEEGEEEYYYTSTGPYAGGGSLGANEPPFEKSTTKLFGSFSK